MSLLVRRSTDWLLILAWLILSAASIPAQSQPEQPKQNQDDVIRVNTELVQTDVMVFDKKGHFVGGLKPEQFALRVDNKPQTVSFLEHVKSTGGPRTEEDAINSRDGKFCDGSSGQDRILLCR